MVLLSLDAFLIIMIFMLGLLEVMEPCFSKHIYFILLLSGGLNNQNMIQIEENWPGKSFPFEKINIS